jgi:hypothetical protein
MIVPFAATDLRAERCPLREAYSLLVSDFAKRMGSVLALLVIAATAWAQQTPDNRTPSSADEIGRFLDIKIPKGFKAEPVDEPGIMRWRKDDAEIYAVMGELFSDSTEKLLSVLHKAAEKDKKMAEVKSVRLKGARGLLLKEKPPEDSGRLRGWRMFLVADKKVLSLDFTAPAKDFDSFAPAFEEAIKSVKIKSPS